MATFSSGIGKQLTASGSVKASAGLLLGYAIQHGTTTQSSVTFRDGGSGGTIKWVHSKEAVTAAGDATDKCIFSVPIVFSTDIYVALTGTGTKICVIYV